MAYENICIGCLAEKENASICPVCGFDEKQYSASPLFLPPRTFLDHRYLIGRVLGNGGFGVTYLALDFVLQIKVAIKEFLPRSLAIRVPGTNRVSAHQGAEALFGSGRKQFIEEARALAQFNQNPAVVTVNDFVSENNTAYLVMEYLEGMTLKTYLERRMDTIAPELAVAAVLPVIAGLEEVHSRKMLHRDISPGNIFITNKRQSKMIDFGAARYLVGKERQNLSVLFKPGYTPWEQYSQYGKQGPWTDVYAMGATLYRAITGQIPVEAFCRIEQDVLLPPSRLGVVIASELERVILQALAVEIEARYQSMAELYDALIKAAPRAASIPDILQATFPAGKNKVKSLLSPIPSDQGRTLTLKPSGASGESQKSSDANGSV